MRRWVAAILIALIVALFAVPDLASACPVCAKPADGDAGVGRWAIYASTAGLVALPMAMVGLLVSWLRRR